MAGELSLLIMPFVFTLDYFTRTKVASIESSAHVHVVAPFYPLLSAISELISHECTLISFTITFLGFPEGAILTCRSLTRIATVTTGTRGRGLAEGGTFPQHVTPRNVHRKRPSAHRFCRRLLLRLRRVNPSDKRGSTRHRGCTSSRSCSADRSWSRRRGPGRCHRRRSGMAPASRCPCWCTSVRPPCSPRHLLETHTRTEGTLFNWSNIGPID